jgi:hypothetical protein
MRAKKSRVGFVFPAVSFNLKGELPMGGSSTGGSWSSLGDVRALEEKAKRALEQGKRRNVFISFSFEDVDEVNLLRAQAKNEKSDIEFNDRSVKEAYDSERADYIKRRLAERINQASTTVVFASENTAASKWVRWEVEKSMELGKRVILTHVGETPPKNLPSWLRAAGVKVVPWSSLAAEL